MDNTYLELGEWKFWVIFPVINRELITNSTTQGSRPRPASMLVRRRDEEPRSSGMSV
jgi:hypothetical protein